MKSKWQVIVEAADSELTSRAVSSEPITHDLVSCHLLGALPFREAALAWLESRRHHLAPRTFIDYERYIHKLSEFFGHMRLAEISGDQLRAYQHSRMTTAGPSFINKELGLISQMRRRIGVPMRDYQRLPMPKSYESPGRSLTEAEEAKLERVFRAAANHPTWDTAALCSLLSMKSGCGPGEILALRMKDVCLDPPTITIPRHGAKRVSRERELALNESAAWALQRLVNRATKRCGCSKPEHFLVPGQRRNHTFDPTRPASGYRTLEKLLGIAEIKMRAYDLRHHAVSRALGDPRVSMSAAVAYFGWVSPKMAARYFHGSKAMSAIVAAAIDPKPANAKKKPARKTAVVEIAPSRQHLLGSGTAGYTSEGD